MSYQSTSPPIHTHRHTDTHTQTDRSLRSTSYIATHTKCDSMLQIIGQRHTSINNSGIVGRMHSQLCICVCVRMLGLGMKIMIQYYNEILPTLMLHHNKRRLRDTQYRKNYFKEQKKSDSVLCLLTVH